jgi:hypothetical protein
MEARGMLAIPPLAAASAQVRRQPNNSTIGRGVGTLPQEHAMAPDEAELNIREHITRIDRAIAENAKYAAVQRELAAEARNFDRNCWQIVVTATIAGAALFGAGAAFMKLLIG